MKARQVHFIGAITLIFSISSILIGCGESTLQPAPPSTPSLPQTAKVYRMPTYSVTVTSDVKYGEGLTHSSWNSDQFEPMDLLLDMYLPENDEIKRPVVVFIHGGGFRGGDKLSSRSSEMMHFFAERGFAAFSINYRLLSDYGTIPDTLNSRIDDSVEFELDQKDQVKAIYPATRDAKAAIRWLSASAEDLGLDTQHITAIGGSAGSYISIALGATNASDFTDEISQQIDTSLAFTNLGQSATVHTVIDHWGGTGAVDLIEGFDGQTRWDPTDAPISIVHGTEDLVVEFEQAERLVDIYTDTGVTYAFYPLEGAPHGAWGAMVNDMTLSELAYDFILQTQNLVVIE